MIALYLLFALAVTLHQIRRLRRVGADSLSFIGAGFVLVYGLAPAYIYLTDADKVMLETGIIIPYVDSFTQLAPVSPIALALYIMAYLLVCAGYSLTNRRRSFSTSPLEISSSFYRTTALICAFLGIASLGLYILKLGGIRMFFSSSMYLRSDADAIFRFGIQDFAFLKNSSMILLSASILAATGILAGRGRRSWELVMVVAITFIASLALLVHQGGRLFLAAYIGSFLFARFIGRREVPIFKISAGVVLFACFATIGKALFWSMTFDDVVNLEDISPTRVYHTMMSEILFPHIAATTAITAVPESVNYRLFVDIPIAIANLTPSAFGFTKFKNIADINTDLIATGSPIPVDLVGFGYYSAGMIGVVIWSFFFGSLGGWLDSLLNDSKRVWSIARAFCAVTFGLRVAYSEPTHIIIASFHLLIVLGFGVPFIYWARGRGAQARIRGRTRLVPNEPRVPGNVVPSGMV